MIEKRSSGILMHITSLPSKFGIGDLGPSAFDFADFLEQGGQKFWQVLPLNPTTLSKGNSPYSSPSAFAGNTLLISPEKLVGDGFLTEQDIIKTPCFSNKKVVYSKVTVFKQQMINKAFANYQQSKIHQEAFETFKGQNHWWVKDYALFVALSEYYKTDDWNQWPEALKQREQGVMNQHYEQLADQIEKECFAQFLFFRQWHALKNYCSNRNIRFIGDLPFYIDYNSVDVWANQHYFKLGENGYPAVVSGVPPDYYSKTGQLWGTPVYNWERLQEHHFDWWINRIDKNLELFDMIRLDHFRAFSAYWEVAASEKTAVNGIYQKVPGEEFFSMVKQKHQHLPFIAEDLGDIDQPVRNLINQFSLPNMKLLLFAFGDDMANNSFIPHHHYRNCVVYTGTHDNNTVKGWFRKEAGKAGRKRLRKYTGKYVTMLNVNRVLLLMGMGSVANLVVFPLQDVMGLNEKNIMNRPGTTQNNWIWRIEKNKIKSRYSRMLKKLVCLYARK